MRIRKLSCLKLTILTGFAIFIVINIKSVGEDEQNLQADEEHPENGKRNIANIRTKDTDTLESVAAQSSQSKAKLDPGESEAADSLAGERINELPNPLSSREDSQVNQSQDKQKSQLSLQDIQKKIKEANNAQIIHNESLFGPISNDTIIIVVQVHDRIKYLRHLIKSLSLAAGIDQTLLIFSHDVWDEQLNYLVRSIDFALVLQIFYPFSLQTHTHTFPGESSRDCPRDATQHRVISSKCTNSAWPDIHGHYREAKFTQTKHHWWWKANQVFHNIKVSKDFQGYFLFLEEDHYASEDFLHVLKLMIDSKNNFGSQVDILCLGTYLRKFNFRANSKQAEVSEWISSKHNMGMAFTRTEWIKMVACSSSFCKYDDYNWDWSLQHVSLNCMQDKLQVMMVKGPRVFHIGECGVHHKKSRCDSDSVIEKLKTIIKTANRYFFPDSLSVSRLNTKRKTKLKKANGGWGDKRDHWLCMNFTLSSFNML